MAQETPQDHLQHVMDQAAAAHAIITATGRLDGEQCRQIARTCIRCADYFLNPTDQDDR